MVRNLILSGMFALAAPSLLGAQTVRWNDRPTTTWSDEAPRVRVYIDGPRGVPFGAPMRVRFEVSDNAYVTVVRVDDEGRMTILFPYSRTQRATARAGQVYYVRTPRIGGDFAFIANDRMGGGYVFAVASYVPLDFSSFENRDYDRIGGWSRFTVSNRSIARRPDVFIDRFAARVLWNPDTPYDYDVDYYHSIGYPGMMSAYGMCGASSLGLLYGSRYGMGGFYMPIGSRNYLAQLSSWDRMQYPFFYMNMCGDWYNRLQCYSSMSMYSSGYGLCRDYGRFVVSNEPTPGTPVTPGDPTKTPNEGVVRGGLFAPTPVPVPVAGPDAPPLERPIGRFDQPLTDELDNVMSIPARATRKMKDDDAKREREAIGSVAPARTGFDRADAPASKPEKVASGGERDAATRLQPPTREPTKAKATGEPRRETVSKGGYGSTGTSNPRPSSGPDRVNRPAERPASAPANPPSIQGTTTEKKKPPTI